MMSNEKLQQQLQKLINDSEGGIKLDSEKLRYDLIPPDALEELAKVYTFGARKYGDRNWEKGLRWGRVFGAVFRHFIAWAKGEDADEETGLHPLAHAAWGCLTLLAYAKRGIGQDDRPSSTPAVSPGGRGCAYHAQQQ